VAMSVRPLPPPPRGYAILVREAVPRLDTIDAHAGVARMAAGSSFGIGLRVGHIGHIGRIVRGPLVAPRTECQNGRRTREPETSPGWRACSRSNGQSSSGRGH
jgi:hypothetical protein